MKPTNEHLVLQALAESSHGLRRTEIVAHTHLDIAQVDTAMAELKAEGLIVFVCPSLASCMPPAVWQITRAGISRLNSTQDAA
jgi:hypothetical protein